MNTSLKWIKALVPGLDCGVQEYVDAMTLSGSKVEGYEQLDADLDKIVVGHPDTVLPLLPAEKKWLLHHVFLIRPAISVYIPDSARHQR